MEKNKIEIRPFFRYRDRHSVIHHDENGKENVVSRAPMTRFHAKLLAFETAQKHGLKMRSPYLYSWKRYANEDVFFGRMKVFKQKK